MQTSIINVVILSKDEVDFKGIDKSKVVVSYYKDSGRGGQHRNKTMSGVRLQYDDIIVTCCDTRDQRKNKELAFLKLEDKLKQENFNKSKELIKEQYRTQNKNNGSRGDYNRNYNFPRNEVVQDGIRIKLSKFLKGDFGKLY
jgi:protein subunit release factor A